jgi:peptide methionine sulfoxide reductase MsrB
MVTIANTAKALCLLHYSLFGSVTIEVYGHVQTGHLGTVRGEDPDTEDGDRECVPDPAHRRCGLWHA